MRLYNSTGLRHAQLPHIFFCYRIKYPGAAASIMLQYIFLQRSAAA
jgi:hypothetical protein